MTDPLTPNDLSHLSDDEFNALCPQGEHAPGSEPLSPAAQAVANAIEPLDWESGHCTYEDICFISRQVAATALRVAADQVVPPDPCGDDCCIDLSIGIRADLLAIAAELENGGAR